MPRHSVSRIWSAILLVLLFTNVSCGASTQVAAMPPANVPLTPSPTPFQPGIYDIPIIPVVSPQAVATYTPYPVMAMPENGISNPQIVIPANAAIGASTNPLTGLSPADPSLLDRRPLAIKVANYPRYVRPQSGLTLADVVFEYYIEALLTRFVAIFYGNNAARVGPVRSGRFFDEHITRMYHAFYIFKFADPRELNYFKSSDFADFLIVPGYGLCPSFVTGKQKRDSYNNVFYDTTRHAECVAKKKIDNSRPILRNSFFSEDVQHSVLIAHRVFTHYSVDDYNYWEYDPAARKYFRYQEKADTRNGKAPTYEALMDEQTNLPVTTDNVVVLFIPHTFENQNQAEDEVYHIDLLDSGEAYVFRDGMAFPARWHRTDIDQPLYLSDLNDMPIYLRPGQTFYQVIGRTSTFSQSDADWYFNFKTP